MVNDLSFDGRFEFLASCSDDGTVAVGRPPCHCRRMPLETRRRCCLKWRARARPERLSPPQVHTLATSERSAHDFRRPVKARLSPPPVFLPSSLQNHRPPPKPPALSRTSPSASVHPLQSVALDPGYSQKTSRQFAAGGLAGQLVLNSKGWLGDRNHVLHSGEGTVHSVRWMGTFIAWANDVGVKVYNAATHQRVTYIDRPKGLPRPELFRPHLVWAEERQPKHPGTLIIAWADCVKVAKMTVRGTSAEEALEALERGMEGAPTMLLTCEVVAVFQTDYFISGVAPFGDGHLIILAFVVDNAEDDKDGAGAGAGAVAGARVQGQQQRGGQDGAGPRQGSLRPEARCSSLSRPSLRQPSPAPHAV